MGLPTWFSGKESACNVGDLGSILGLGRSPGGGHGNLLQDSCLENPYGQRSLKDAVHGVTKSQSLLSNYAQRSQYRRCKGCRLAPWVRKIPWRRKWQPTPVFLPVKSHGQKSLQATVHGVAKSCR